MDREANINKMSSEPVFGFDAQVSANVHGDSFQVQLQPLTFNLSFFDKTGYEL